MNALLAALLNAGIAGTAVTIAVWAALSVAPRRWLNAATRYAVWWATLLVVVTLPLFYLPHRGEAVPAPRAAVATSAPMVAVAASVPVETKLPEVADTVRSRSFPLEFDAGEWPVRIFTAWRIVGIFLLLRLGASYWMLERRKRRARPAEDLHWPVRALISSEIASPMAAGLFRPAILLPEKLLDELSHDELEQIRVHETAHLLRRDDAALLMQRTIEALFPLHPLVRWIARQIDLEREIACDDFVVQETGQARPYASCLTRVVEIAGGVRSSMVAAAAAEERSHLARRIEMLLDKTRHTGTRLLKARLASIVAALFVLAGAAITAPGPIAFASESQNSFYEPPAPPEPPEPQSESHGGRTVTVRSNDGLHSRELRIRGDVHFNDDETDVQSISPDGSFAYQESFAFSSRRFEASADSSGRIARRYFVDDREKALDADGKAWLRAAIPGLLRESGVDAAERVRRILRQGGAPAVLAEIAKIRSDGSKKLYIQKLAPIGHLTPDQFQSVLRVVRGIGSDGEKAASLVFLAPYTLKDGLRDFTFEAVNTIHSDGEKHRVLSQFILHDTSRGTLTEVARSALDIHSDGEKAAVLIDLSPYLRGNSDLARPFFRAAASIHSDGEHARVLTAALSSAGEQRDTLVEALRSAEGISSDGEKANVLVHAEGYWKDDDLVRQTYFETAGSVRSDGEKARVLASVVGRAGLSDRTLVEAVHCAEGIHSDGEKSRVLVAIADHSNGKSNVREEIGTAARSIHSDGEYRRVMAALDLRANGLANRP